MADVQNKNSGKHDLDSMLDEVSADAFALGVFDDEEEEAIERLLMGPAYQEKPVHTERVLDPIDQLLQTAEAPAPASSIETKNAQSGMTARDIDVLLDNLTDVDITDPSLLQEQHDPVDLDLLSGKADVLEQALQATLDQGLGTDLTDSRQQEAQLLSTETPQAPVKQRQPDPLDLLLDESAMLAEPEPEPEPEHASAVLAEVSATAELHSEQDESAFGEDDFSITAIDELLAEQALEPQKVTAAAQPMQDTATLSVDSAALNATAAHLPFPAEPAQAIDAFSPSKLEQQIDHLAAQDAASNSEPESVAQQLEVSAAARLDAAELEAITAVDAVELDTLLSAEALQSQTEMSIADELLANDLPNDVAELAIASASPELALSQDAYEAIPAVADEAGDELSVAHESDAFAELATEAQAVDDFAEPAVPLAASEAVEGNGVVSEAHVAADDVDLEALLAAHAPDSAPEPVAKEPEIPAAPEPEDLELDVASAEDDTDLDAVLSAPALESVVEPEVADVLPVLDVEAATADADIASVPESVAEAPELPTAPDAAAELEELEQELATAEDDTDLDALLSASAFESLAEPEVTDALPALDVEATTADADIASEPELLAEVPELTTADDAVAELEDLELEVATTEDDTDLDALLSASEFETVAEPDLVAEQDDLELEVSTVDADLDLDELLSAYAPKSAAETTVDELPVDDGLENAADMAAVREPDSTADLEWVEEDSVTFAESPALSALTNPEASIADTASTETQEISPPVDKLMTVMGLDEIDALLDNAQQLTDSAGDTAVATVAKPDDSAVKLAPPTANTDSATAALLAMNEVNQIQGNSVADIDQTSSDSKIPEADFLIADFDISSDDEFDNLVPTEQVDAPAAAEAETSIELSEEPPAAEVIIDDLIVAEVVESEPDTSAPDLTATAEPAAQIERNDNRDDIDPTILGQITSLWAAHDLLKQQFAASATQPTSNEFLADELDMLAKEQKAIRRSVESNNNKTPTLQYVTLGISSLALLLGACLLAFSISDSGVLNELTEQTEMQQKELEVLKTGGAGANSSELQTAIADLSAKVESLQKHTAEQNQAAQIAELQTALHELKTSMNSHASPAETKEAHAEVAPDAVKVTTVKAEVVKDEPIKVPEPVIAVAKPEPPKHEEVKAEALKPAAPKPTPVAVSKLEKPAKLVADAAKKTKAKLKPSEPQPQPYVENTKPEPVAAPAPVPKVETVTAKESGRWAANLVSFRQDWYAQGKAAEFAKQGIYVQVVPVQVKGETWYRLRSEGFANKNDAQTYANKAKRQLNLSSVWVTDD